MSSESVLRAMSKNYRRGHSWDHLDSEACQIAADEIKSLTTKVKELEAELETERMRLAACGVAALGYFDDCKDEYRSASLGDTLRLYTNHAAEQSKVKVLTDALEKIAFSRVGAVDSIAQELFDRERWAEEALATVKGE